MPDQLKHTTASASTAAAPGVIFWFRQDLRLHDQPALMQAMALARGLGGWLLPVHVDDPSQDGTTRWGFQRRGPRRKAWTAMALEGLSQDLEARGSRLLRLRGAPARVLAALQAQLGQPWVVCEEIAAPEEQAQLVALRTQGVRLQTVWQSTLMAPEDLPFAPQEVPDTFTHFRQALERQGVRPCRPLPPPDALPPPPAPALWASSAVASAGAEPAPQHPEQVAIDACTSFPMNQPAFHGSAQAALAHLHRYCERQLPHSYKTTRNDLSGIDFSSKWSPWLATGALSARTAQAAITAFEDRHGASPDSYWLFFELLWRDHFRWLHLKHGVRLYRAGGLGDLPTPRHNDQAFRRWCEGRTGQDFIDAGMRELAATGYLSNRMRQNVASYLIHDLGCDWRAGAAWFESCLIDYDVYSNQGNWLYLSGRGTDPRGSRRFNPDKQAQTYDPDGHYRKRWLR